MVHELMEGDHYKKHDYYGKARDMMKKVRVGTRFWCKSLFSSTLKLTCFFAKVLRRYMTYA